MDSFPLHLFQRQDDQSRQPCLKVDDICTVEDSIYGYRPSIAWNALFLALFALSAIIHAIQGIRYKTWTFMGAMVIGGAAEAVGK
jgi:hypothetical protein